MFFVWSCQTIPNGVKAVQPFDLDRYLGTWYEIARFDFSFEKNLSNVSATYSLKENGGIKVDNKGFDYIENKWKQSIGKAKPVGDKNTAMLKVSFFGPFYAGYNVIAIDSNYQYALVAGQSTSYLWILSRQKTIPDDVKNSYLEMAKKNGFDIGKLVWTKHDQ